MTLPTMSPPFGMTTILLFWRLICFLCSSLRLLFLHCPLFVGRVTRARIVALYFAETSGHKMSDWGMALLSVRSVVNLLMRDLASGRNCPGARSCGTSCRRGYRLSPVEVCSAWCSLFSSRQGMLLTGSLW